MERMATAAVAAAGMTAFAVTVMVASDVGIITEVAREQCLNCRIARTNDTAEQRNACLRKCHLCTATNTTTNEDINLM